MIPELIRRRGAVHLDETPPPPALHPPRAVLDLVPESVARENRILPLALSGETLTCAAAADPGNVHLADKLGFLLNKKIRLVHHLEGAVLEAINWHYGGTETESVDSLLAEFTDTAIDATETEYKGNVTRTGPVRAKRLGALSRALGAFSGPGRYLGKGLVEFKKGIKGLEESESGTPAGEDMTPDYGRDGIWHYVVEEGQRALMIGKDGRIEIVVGPRRVWKWGKRFERMRHFVARPGEFLVVRYRDGRQEHPPGPADVWFDPRVHEQITRQEALQLAAKEAVIVYSRSAEAVSRRIVYGPTLFVPAPGEWLHTFQWHGAEGGSQGVKKHSKGLVFQKLWLLPDQMYHDVTDVRTADDAVLTLRLMLFFELLDVERMLETTHDPIGDFINAATSDVIDFTGRRTFEAFKQETGRLNELETYRQLTARAAQNGYRVNKVVYRGYGAPDRLQAMHDQAIEARTRLQLERATEEQAQSLEDYKLNAQVKRAASRRGEQAVEVDTELVMARQRHEAELRHKEAERTAARDQRFRDAEAEQELRRRAEERQRQHFAALKELGVDLTAYLTQSRADRVIELRGGAGKPHVHLGAGEDGK